MSVNQKSADRLNNLAAEKGLAVRIASSRKPARRWYSIGNNHAGQWHQVTGSTEISTVEQYLGLQSNGEG